MIKTPRLTTLVLLGFLMFGIAALIDAAGAEDKGTEELAKAAQNPVADLISLPLQNNINFG